LLKQTLYVEIRSCSNVCAIYVDEELWLVEDILELAEQRGDADTFSTCLISQFAKQWLA